MGGIFYFTGGGCQVLKVKPCRHLCPFVLHTICSALNQEINMVCLFFRSRYKIGKQDGRGGEGVGVA